MNPKILFLFYLFLILISLSSENPNYESSNSTPSSSPAHKELTKYGFPSGLLPATTILDFAVDQSSGDFSVNLGDGCRITLPPDNYVASYSERITGKIFRSRISKLHGIRIWAFFKWWSITGIRAAGDDIVFEVGIVKAKYPLKNFDESPACDGQYSAS